MPRRWNKATRGREEGGKGVPGTQKGSTVRIEAHGDHRKRDLSAEEGGGKQHFLPEPRPAVWERRLKPADTWWFLVTPEASMERGTSRTKQWTKWTAVGGDLFRFRCPPGEGRHLGEGSTQLRTWRSCGWLHLAIPSVKVRQS